MLIYLLTVVVIIEPLCVHPSARRWVWRCTKRSTNWTLKQLEWVAYAQTGIFPPDWEHPTGYYPPTREERLAAETFDAGDFDTNRP